MIFLPLKSLASSRHSVASGMFPAARAESASCRHLSGFCDSRASSRAVFRSASCSARSKRCSVLGVCGHCKRLLFETLLLEEVRHARTLLLRHRRQHPVRCRQVATHHGSLVLENLKLNTIFSTHVSLLSNWQRWDKSVTVLSLTGWFFDKV